MDLQPELPLPPPPLRPDQPYVPARMVNEFQYCPRLAYLEWVQGEWAESADTVEGRGVHRRVDGRSGELPEAEAIGHDERIHARSVSLSSDRLGLIAKLDLVEAEDGAVVPVDYKRGKRPHVAAGAYEPELVQLCVQGLILEDNGYHCTEGALYFRGSRERVRVPFDAGLRSKALAAVSGLRLVAAGGHIPPPLEDSPKCPRCSLVAICMPEEVNFLRHGVAPRPLAANRDLSLPIYVQASPARVRKRCELLVIQTEEPGETTARLIDTSHLVLVGAVDVTAPVLHELMRREIPVSIPAAAGFSATQLAPGIAMLSFALPSIVEASTPPSVCVWPADWSLPSCAIAERCYAGTHARTRPWKRLWAGSGARSVPSVKRKRLTNSSVLRATARPFISPASARCCARTAPSCRILRLKTATDVLPRIRSMRCCPLPTPMLVRELTATLTAVGFDPYRGFYHRPRYGRPALALDVMEPFRPILADSVVITAINNGEVRASDFVRAGLTCALTPSGRKKMIAAFERRLAQEITHPVFGYRLSYRRLLEVQARLLGRHLMGEIPDLPPVEPR